RALCSLTICVEIRNKTRQIHLNLNSMLDWAGEEPANPGVTGNQNSNTPTCVHSVMWNVRSSVKSGGGI
ncbi:hypothetical protein, partial [uncultured Bacteroides sp.]|uniref:hypothetical protein n=1 Tax=uncultured Bacteroides sp. TaxID=162156 RepID=UPI00259A37EC